MLKKFSKRIVIYLLVVGILFSACSIFASAKLQNKLDAVFVVDTSKAMESKWQSVIASIKSNVKFLDDNNIDYRVVIIEFRDVKSRTTDLNDYTYKTSAFMKGSSVISNYLDRIELSGNANSSSCLFSALIDSYHKLTFRYNAYRAYYVIGVTPPYNPEPETGFNLLSIVNTFSLNESNPSMSHYKFNTYNLGTDYNCDYFYKELSRYSGGKYYGIQSSSSKLTEDLTSSLYNEVSYAVFEGNVVVLQKTIYEEVEDYIDKLPDGELKNMIANILRVYARLYDMLFGKYFKRSIFTQ